MRKSERKKRGQREKDPGLSCYEAVRLCDKRPYCAATHSFGKDWLWPTFKLLEEDCVASLPCHEVSS